MASGQIEAAHAAARSPGNRFTPVYFLLVMPVFLLFWYGSVYNLILVLPGIFIALIITVVLIVQAVLCCRRQHGRRLASIVAAPFLSWAILASLSHTGLGPHWVHLQLRKQAYLDEIAQCQCGPTGQRFKTFDWGGTGGLMTPNIFYILVYDESDQIALPANMRTEAWDKRAGAWAHLQPGESRGGSDKAINLSILEGHFYLVTEIYQ